MSTITKERIELFIKNPLENGLTRGEQMELARIALASLEAKPIGAFHIAEQQVDGTSDYLKDGEWPIDNGIIEVYAAPPVPVVPEEKPMPNPLSMYAVDAVAAIAEVRGWNACRAAMLQGADVSLTHEGKNHHEDKLGMVNHLGDVTEKVEPVTQIEPVADLYGLTSPTGGETSFTFDAVEARDFIDGGWSCQEYVELERFQEAVSGNSPVIQDGWISCSERMPDDGQHVIILCDGAFVLYAQYRDSEFFDVVRNGEEFFETQSRNVTHWMPLPAAPQQEVNRG